MEGDSFIEGLLLTEGFKGIFWLEVKYREDKSLFISSIMGVKPVSLESVGCPFLIIVIGLPLLPLLDQLLL